MIIQIMGHAISQQEQVELRKAILLSMQDNKTSKGKKLRTNTAPVKQSAPISSSETNNHKRRSTSNKIQESKKRKLDVPEVKRPIRKATENSKQKAVTTKEIISKIAKKVDKKTKIESINLKTDLSKKLNKNAKSKTISQDSETKNRKDKDSKVKTKADDIPSSDNRYTPLPPNNTSGKYQYYCSHIYHNRFVSIYISETQLN